MLGDGLGAFKLLPAFVATILVGWHGLESSNEGGSTMQNFTPGVREVHPKSAQRFLAVGKRSFLSVIDRPPQNGDRLLDVGVCVVPLLDHVRQVELVPPVAMPYHRPRRLRLDRVSGFVWRLLLHPIQAISDAAPVRHKHHHRHQLPVTGATSSRTRSPTVICAKRPGSCEHTGSGVGFGRRLFLFRCIRVQEVENGCFKLLVCPFQHIQHVLLCL